MKLTQKIVFNALKRTEYNTNEIIKKSGLQRDSVINRLIGRIKGELKHSDLERLWDAIPDKWDHL